MGRRYRCKCRHCQKFFIPDARNAKRQQYCGEGACRAASKAASQRRWLSKPENRDVFKGPIHVARVQAWRKAHPGYWRRPPPGGSVERLPLQDSLIAQAVDNDEETGQFVEPALQDLLTAQPAILLGLIAQFSDSTLQDDIARVGHHLLQLGHDVLNGQGPGEGASHDSQTADLPRQSQAPPVTIQLD
jgi:hypothetical protein